MEAHHMSSLHHSARWIRAWRVVIPILVVALSPCVLVGAHLAQAVNDQSEKVVFRDDFNGTRLDASKWNASWFGNGSNASKPVNGAENTCYDPHQVVVKNGYLVLAAVPQKCLGYQYSSGLVNSNGKFSFTTGVMTARIWLYSSTGRTVDWPAVWTNGQHWPNDGEIDVLEGLGGHDCWHVHTLKPTVGTCSSMTGGWHVVKLVRTKTSLTFFYDGKKVGTSSPSMFVNCPHYLVLELAVSNVYSPPMKPAFMLVDWVQVTT
jgi:beta-glucanase (GH16 family)